MPPVFGKENAADPSQAGVSYAWAPAFLLA